MGKKRSNHGGNNWHVSKQDRNEVTKQAPKTTQRKTNECDLCHKPTVLRYPGSGAQWLCSVCFDKKRTREAKLQWREVLALIDRDGYDPNCGMASEAEFIAELANAILSDPDGKQIAQRLAQTHKNAVLIRVSNAVVQDQ